jgi:pimeloyl-ACP methyl ester carboxylesterase
MELFLVDTPAPHPDAPTLFFLHGFGAHRSAWHALKREGKKKAREN